jgi:hypothetical protein
MASSGSGAGATPPFWVRVAPFFLSAALFASGFLALIAPLPLLVLGALTRRLWTVVALLVNALVVYALAGWASAGLFLGIVGTISLVLPELLRLRWGPTRVAAVTASAWVGIAFAALQWVAWNSGVSLWDRLEAFFSQGLTAMVDSLGPEGTRSWLGLSPDVDLSEVRSLLLREVPAALAIVGLAFIALNLTLLMRLNPGRIRERSGWSSDVFRSWKAPEWLVWPTLAAGAMSLFGPEAGSAWAFTVGAKNVFKVLMAIYGIQGLSVLGFAFTAWRVRPLFRSLGYAFALFFFLPLLLALGFFDLWFDFRAKLRQS